MKKEDYIFYDENWTIILDSLIKFFPFRLAFKLYDIQEKEQLKYDDLVTNGFTLNPTVYKNISDFLVYNDFANDTNNGYITLTDKGRFLIEAGSYKEYVKLEDLKKKAEKRDLEAKKYYKLIEFLKMFISFLLGLLSAYITYRIFQKC